jgi:hypothetical protein
MAVSMEYVSHVPTVLDGRGDGHRQNQQRGNEDDHAVGLEPGQRQRQEVGKQANSNSAAIEGRERQHVEYRQDYIDEEGVAEVLRDPRGSLRG